MHEIQQLIDSGIKIRQTKPSKALSLFMKARELSGNRDKQLMESTFNIAIAQLNLADFKESMKYFHETLTYGSCKSNPFVKAEVYRGIGTIHLRTNNYKEAIKNFTKSEQLSIESKNYQNLHMTYGSFSSLYYKLKINDKALEYSRKSMEIAEKSDTPEMIQYSVMSVGACYFTLNNYSLAEKFLEHSLGMGCNPFAETNALYILAMIRFEGGDIESASTLTQKQIEIARKYNYYVYEALGLAMSGDILAGKDMLPKAIDKYNEAIRIVDGLNDKLVSFSLYKRLIKLYEKLGDAKTLSMLYKKMYNDQEHYLENESRLDVINYDIKEELGKIKKEVEHEKEMNTRLHKALKEISGLNRKLEKMNEEKNNFMAFAVHDLKNPLINILSAVKLMKRRLSDKESIDLSSNIVSQSERMLNLIKRLLDHNAIEQGRIKIECTTFKPAELCEDLIYHYKPLASRKKITLRLENHCNGAVLKTDYEIVFQILENLVSNSIKYSPENTFITLSASQTHEGTVFGVTDQGPGFSETDKQKVFTKFAKLSARPTGDEHSTGLGLSIVKKLCGLIGSEITLDSMQGQGATFKLILPGLSPGE